MSIFGRFFSFGQPFADQLLSEANFILCGLSDFSSRFVWQQLRLEIQQARSSHSQVGVEVPGQRFARLRVCFHRFLRPLRRSRQLPALRFRARSSRGLRRGLESVFHRWPEHAEVFRDCLPAKGSSTQRTLWVRSVSGSCAGRANWEPCGSFCLSLAGSPTRDAAGR